MFGWIFAAHGDCSVFPIEITAIHTDSQAVETAIVLLPLRDISEENREDVTMTTIAAARRSSFGMRCAHCDNELIAPEWTEHRDERHVRHLWHCWRCDCCFETVVDTTKMTTKMTTGEITPSRLVA
jgi:hypothetical protein